MTQQARQIKLTLIVAPRKCAKCVKCQELVARLQERFPECLDYHLHTTDDEAAGEYGVVLPPVLVVDNFIAAMGSVPQEDKLAELIQRKLQSPS